MKLRKAAADGDSEKCCGIDLQCSLRSYQGGSGTDGSDDDSCFHGEDWD